MTTPFKYVLHTVKDAYQLGRAVFANRPNWMTLSARYPRFRTLAWEFANRQLLDVKFQAVDPVADPDMAQHVRENVVNFVDFRAWTFYYVEANWNIIYDGYDIPESSLVHTEVVSSGERGRLMQILEACEPGTYGYYMKSILGRVAAVVGNSSAATIDVFFGNRAEYLNQPMGPALNQLLSTQETAYWRSQRDPNDYLAGRLLGQKAREILVECVAWLRQAWEGQRVPHLPDGSALSEEQVADVLNKLDDALNAGIQPGDLNRMSQDLYKQKVLENLGRD
ncbi:hypothetical protein [Streptomyces wuyuanensis]|uniref:hypothetical protein n=1 Tax=Streptomyces wuyuanensis TaxID=1196353 RepID=UPI00341CFD2F